MMRWRRADPQVVDALLAAACAAVTLATVAAVDEPGHPPHVDALAVALLLGQTVPVVWRRSHAVLAWALAGAAAAIYGIGEFPDTALDIGPLLIVFSVAAYCRRPTATILGLATALVIVVSLAAPGDADAEDVSSALLVFSVAWIAGENLRTRRAYTAELEEKAARLERERVEEAARAAAGERARIAHELHDVVAHHVSMMVVQAEGGASVVQRAPEAATEAFDAISSAGRDAMAEMRRVLGVLRNEPRDGHPQESGEAAPDRRPAAPQPGLDSLDELVARVRQAGLAVELRREGQRPPLPPGLDLSAFRIVQEALTNTVRHAAASSATVVVRYLAGAVELEVDDDGTGPPNGSAPAGHGLVGMRERVALFGGELRIGPRNGGGFRVVARLPVTP